jgi:predicted nucleic acid-binding protein
VIVVDASVLANVVGDDHDDGGLVRARLQAETQIVAPDLVDVETVAVLRRRWLTGDLDDERFAEAITLLESIPIHRFPARPLLRRAYELRANVTAYDAMYVALAEQLDATVVTGDSRLAGAPCLRCQIEVLAGN